MLARRCGRISWLPLVALFLAIENAPSDASAGRDPGNSVPLHLEDDGVITVQVRIDASGPFTLLLDTGSNRSAVSRRIARAMHLTAVARTTRVTAAGSSASDVVQLDAITLGSVTKRGLLVTVLDDADRASLGEELDGILGQDFLLGETYTLDYEHRRLLWEAKLPTRGEMTRLSLKQDEGRWLVALPQNHERSETLWFVPDSGTSTLIVFDQGMPLTLGLRPMPCCATMRTVTGSLDARIVLIDRLQVGAIVLRNRPALVASRRSPDAPAGDGLLPLSMFRSVSFEPSTRSLIVRERQ